MGDSLKDQLVALGLAKADRSKARKRRGGAPRSPKPGSSGNAKQPSLDEAYRLREQDERRAAQAKKERKRAEDLLRRQVNAKVQQIVDAHALNDPAAELKRNFLYKGRIRSVLVTPEQLRALNAGELGVVFLRGGYFIMQPGNVQQVREISSDHVPDLGGDEPDDEQFPVPDDLVW